MGPTRSPGAILLDLSGLDRILAVDEVDRTAVVQPGVLVADLQRAAGEHGLFYAPDPGSAGEATIGGTVATNAGGMRCLKGVSRDAVRSLEVVLADGEVVRTRPATVKGVAGLDLTSLVVGSKGTLAVVTEVTVSLRGSPRARRPGCSPSPTSATRQRPPPRGTPSPVQPGDARAARGSINEDISAPRSRLLELVERVEALSAEIGLVIAVGGHVGDGNLHPVVSFDPADAAQVAAARRAHERILELAGELGGGDR